MKVQKSRLAALIGLMLMVCMMVTMLVVPASAATFEVAYGAGIVYMNKIAASLYQSCHAELHDNENYFDLASSLGNDKTTQGPCAPDGNAAYLPSGSVELIINSYNEKYPDTPIYTPRLPVYLAKDGKEMYRISAPSCVVQMFNPNAGNYTYSTTGKLVDSLEDNSLSGVLNQIIDLLPIVIPVLIGFIGLNKAVKFITGVLHSA